MKKLIKKAMELGVPVTTSKVTSRVSSPQLQQAENVSSLLQIDKYSNEQNLGV